MRDVQNQPNNTDIHMEVYLCTLEKSNSETILKCTSLVSRNSENKRMTETQRNRNETKHVT